MSKLPTVSIIIPAYNEERSLPRCLEAISRQTVPPLEVIVVDNNSTDQTVNIARGYPFVSVVTAPKQGVVYARNQGFDAAKGSIMGRIDADTVLPPDWVATIRHYYASGAHDRNALTGGTMPYNVRFPRFFSWLQGQIAFRLNRVLLGHYILFGSNMAMTTTQWQAVRASTCMRTDIHEDLDLSIHLHDFGYAVEYWAGFLVGTRVRRVRTDRKDLWPNLLWWPNTLRTHGRAGWVFGWIGAALLYVCAAAFPVAEKVATMFGRASLSDY